MIFFIIGVVAALFALAVLLLAKEPPMRRLLFMSKGQARPGSIPGLPAEKNKTKGENNGKI